METALLVVSAEHRRGLVTYTRTHSLTVAEVFEASTHQKAAAVWTRLLAAAHRGSFRVVVLPSLSAIPGGLIQRLAEIRKLHALDVRVISLSEPWLDLGVQGELAGYIVDSHSQQTRDRITRGLERAKFAGRVVGRPRVQVDVPALAAYRETHSLRQTARRFGIGASTAWRLLKAYEDTQRTPADSSKSPDSGARE